MKKDNESHTGVHGESFRSRLALNSVAALASKFGSLLIAFLLLPFIVGHLGDAQYGLWVLVSSIVAYGALAEFGIAAAVTKYVSEYSALGQHHKCRRIIASALCLYSLIGLGLIVLFGAFSTAVPALFNLDESQYEFATRLTVLMGISLGLSIPFSASTAVLQGLHRFDVTALLSTARNLIFAGGVLISLPGGSALDLAISHIVAMVIVQIPAIWWIYRLAPKYRFGSFAASAKDMRKLMKFSWPLFMVNIGGFLQSKSDEIVIGARLPVGLITPYSIALMLSRIPQIVAEQFIGFILPIASELGAKGDDDKMRQLFIVSTRMSFAVFLAIGGVIAIMAKSVIGVWVGESYTHYAVLVWILSAALAIDILQWPAAMILQGLSRHRIFAFIAVGTGIANVVLSVLLAPHLALAGVALATLITATLETVFFVMPYALRTLAIRPAKFFSCVVLPALIPAVLSGLLLAAVNASFDLSSVFRLICAGALALLVYAAIYFTMPITAIEREFVLGTIKTLRK